MPDKDYMLQPLEEIVSKELSPVGRSRRYREEKLPLWENLEHHALLFFALYCAGKGVYGLIMNSYGAALHIGEAVGKAIEFFK